jgi:hypothetical protein
MDRFTEDPGLLSYRNSRIVTIPAEISAVSLFFGPRRQGIP